MPQGPATQVGCWVGTKGCRSALEQAKLGALMESAVEKGQPHSEGPGNPKSLWEQSWALASGRTKVGRSLRHSKAVHPHLAHPASVPRGVMGPPQRVLAGARPSSWHRHKSWPTTLPQTAPAATPPQPAPAATAAPQQSARGSAHPDLSATRRAGPHSKPRSISSALDRGGKQ